MPEAYTGPILPPSTVDDLTGPIMFELHGSGGLKLTNNPALALCWAQQGRRVGPSA